jgi:hypothetical protein
MNLKDNTYDPEVVQCYRYQDFVLNPELLRCCRCKAHIQAHVPVCHVSKNVCVPNQTNYWFFCSECPWPKRRDATTS